MAAFATSTENDRHAKRINDDAAMWQERLEQLADLRRHAPIPDRRLAKHPVETHALHGISLNLLRGQLQVFEPPAGSSPTCGSTWPHERVEPGKRIALRRAAGVPRRAKRSRIRPALHPFYGRTDPRKATLLTLWRCRRSRCSAQSFGAAGVSLARWRELD